MIEFKTGVEGKYRVQLADKDGNIHTDTGFVDNDLLDNFFEDYKRGFDQPNNSFQYLGTALRIGTGTTPVNFSQTTLASQVASFSHSGINNTSEFYLDGTVGCMDWTWVATFSLGQIVANVTELGMCWRLGHSENLNSTNRVHSRVVLPTAVNVTADDQLIVTYKLTARGLEQGNSGTIVLDGTTHNWTANRGTDIWSSIGTIRNNLLQPNTNETQCSLRSGAVVLGGFGVAVSGGSATVESATVTHTNGAVPGQQIRTYRWGINGANLAGGISSVVFPNGSKFLFDPPINKTNTKILDLTLSYTISRV